MDNTNKEIETDKTHIIIRNIHDCNIKINNYINSDVTIENSENITLEGEYEHYGNIKMVNCKNELYNTNQEINLKIRCARSISFNKCENINFKIDKIKELLEVIDSKLGIDVPSLTDRRTSTKKNEWFELKLTGQLKKVKMEECIRIYIESDVKGKNLKLYDVII
ncbi:hypothetical protein EDI_346290 [Entamoeba dispar SAW760]|uniref:C-CAP/cofactor C-like domain-containing protein n=1 Tax=Entamoeba dispar (strain ATCC PRA-260 / SAW760) TaxID=370354 RepID=B0E688_ENTDS|nr:uncharacterized protein EDI_346290 [Entamoeba dispar SAW760]EDR29973.1 hypothetical protein EDI_346290 [Entamoeba dispar SAW760]|eukprot:EDR29973.1 hypothetical protein EDI_346290 [Entamoeba dispar SAW760]